MSEEKLAKRRRIDWCFITATILHSFPQVIIRRFASVRVNRCPYLGKLTVGALVILAGVFPCSAGAADGAAWAVRPVVEVFPASEFGSEAPVWCVAEDPLGRVYVGTDRLLMFDGGKWEQARAQNTPEIRCLTVVDGRVWVGGLNEIGVYTRNLEGGYSYTSYTERIGTSLGVVWQVFSRPEGMVFVCDQSLVIIPASGPPVVRSLPSTPRLSAFATPRSIRVVQSSPDSVKHWQLKGGELSPATEVPPPLRTIQADFATVTEELWTFNAANSVVQWDPVTANLKTLWPPDGELRRAVISGGVSVGTTSYIATLRGGVRVVDSTGRRLRVGPEEGLPSNACYSIAASRWGGVWVGTDRGLAFIHDVERVGFAAIAGSPKDVSVDGDQDVLVSTSEGTFVVRSDVTVERLAGASLSVARGAGHTLIGGFGAIRRLDASGREVGTISTAREQINRVLPRDEGGGFYALSASRIYRVDENDAVVASVDVPQLPANLVEDQQGRIWVGTFSAGIRVFGSDLSPLPHGISAKTLATVGLHQGRPIAFVEGIGILTDDGETVLGSGGLEKFAGTVADRGSAWVIGRDAEHNWRVGEVMDGPDGLVWKTSSAPGLRAFSAIFGVVRTRDRVWIGGDHGLLYVRPDALTPPDLAAPTVASVVLRGTGRDFSRVAGATATSAPLRVAAELRELMVETSQRPWIGREPPALEARLQPLERDWIRVPAGSAWTMRNLAPGRYTLELRHRHLGVPGEVTRLAIVQLPPWYLSPAAFIGYACAGAAAFFGAVRWRTRQILRRTRELEARIAERTRELVEANAAKSNFLAIMSHEIRNPLNGVIGIARMLDELSLGPRENYLVNTLHRCADQLRTTVDDVLDFSRIEQGEITLCNDVFDLREAVTSTIAAADVSGEQLVLTDWSGPEPTVSGDRGKFTQILTNFLTNALKYGVPPRGAITVAVSALEAGGWVTRVNVTNAGPDIPPDEAPRLFESYQRGHDATARRIRGTGLGLAICRRYAAAMGGSVGVTSAGGTTTFFVELPFGLASAVPRSTAAVPRRVAARALAIEDEDYNRLVLGNVLGGLGYQVDWARDGAAALQHAGQRSYDVVFTDLHLPDMDGGALTRQLLELCADPKPPVFAVTAYSTRDKLEECLAAGMAGFISKPITPEKIHRALEQWGGRFVPRSAVATPLPSRVVSLQHIAKLGPVEILVDDYLLRLGREWEGIERELQTDRAAAAAHVHRLVSTVLLVEGEMAGDQLRLLERELRSEADPATIERLAAVCREELDLLKRAVQAAARRAGAVTAASAPR